VLWDLAALQKHQPAVTPLHRLTSSSFPTVIIKALIVPDEGTPPFLQQVSTIDSSNCSSCKAQHLRHIPDMRSRWRTEDAWRQIDMVRVDIKNHSDPSLNGCYYGWKSLALNDLAPNKHAPDGIWGDACIVKLAPDRYDERGYRIVKLGEKDICDIRNEYGMTAVYEDVSEGVVHSGLWKEIVSKLAAI